MAFRKTSSAEAVTSAATTVIGTISLGAGYGLVLGLFGRNWASSAKAGAGTDTAERIKLTDAALRVFFLDAADRDYVGGKTLILTGQDDTATGLTPFAVDATGAAASAGAGGLLVVQSPVTVEIQNAGTATDYFEVYLLVAV